MNLLPDPPFNLAVISFDVIGVADAISTVLYAPATSVSRLFERSTMKKSLSVVAAALAVAAVSAGASAQSGVSAQTPTARLSGAAGQVMVDRGQGFVSSDAASILRAGDVVRTSAATQVVFADGCALPIAAGQAFTVPSVSPCAAQVAGGGQAVETGAGVAAGSASAGGLAAISTTGLVVGGLAAGGLVAVVATVADDDEDEPISR